jgi:hypothetical protein
MPVPSINLHKGQLLVTLTYSGLGVVSNTADFQFGYVEKIYDGCNFVYVSQLVLFPLSKSKQILYGSTMYYIIDETYTLFDEPTPP